MSITALGQYGQLIAPPGELAFVQIEHPSCQAKLYLQGAHLTSFQAKGQGPLLWLSDASQTRIGKAIRGGIPICWPWFGRSQPDFCAHGFARTSLWHLDSYHEQDDEIRVELHLNYVPQDPKAWPYPCRAQISFVFSQQLRIELISENTGSLPMPLSLALHSYFPCANVTEVSVHGLAGCESVEQGQPLPALAADFRFQSGVDRVFFQTPSDQRVTGHRHGELRLRSDNLPSMVLWNPSSDIFAAMDDMGGNCDELFCAENGLMMADERLLAPTEQHRCQLEICLA